MRTLILSPHCDDAPLSMGACLLARVFGHRTDVHVLFSVSAFTKRKLCSDDVRSTTALRHAEERQAAAVAGYQVSFWDLPEPFVRPGFANIADIFSRERDARADCAWSVVVATMRDRLRLATERWDVVFIPLGCGNHIDHQIARDAALDWFGTTSSPMPLAFYEDLPYAGRMPLERIDARVAKIPYGLSPFLCGANMIKSKLALLACYPSQLGVNEVRSVSDHATRVGGERVWLTDAARQALQEFNLQQSA